MNISTHIDGKSLVIGVLCTALVALAMGATSPTDKWDDNQEWEITWTTLNDLPRGNDVTRGQRYTRPGYEPFWLDIDNDPVKTKIYLRKRLK